MEQRTLIVPLPLAGGDFSASPSKNSRESGAASYSVHPLDFGS